MLPKIVQVLLAGVFALGVVACGGSETTETVLAPATTVPAASLDLTPTSVDTERIGLTLGEWEALDDSTGEGAGEEETVGLHPTAPASASALEPVPGHTLVVWDDLVAPGFSVDDIWDRYQDRLDAAAGAEVNEIYEEMQIEFDSASSINTEIDGDKIELEGFITPLSYEEEVITEFLLVPYFGACIHVPPPPVNQTILVTLEEGIDIEDSYGPVRVAGTLGVDSSTTELATAGYRLTAASSRVVSY